MVDSSRLARSSGFARIGRLLKRHPLLLPWALAWLAVLLGSILRPWNELTWMAAGALTFLLLACLVGTLARGTFFLTEGRGAAFYEAHFAPVVAACESFLEAEGRVPTRLDDLTPDYLARLPRQARRPPGSEPSRLLYTRLGPEDFGLAISMRDGILHRTRFEYRSRTGTWELRPGE